MAWSWGTPPWPGSSFNTPTFSTPSLSTLARLSVLEPNSILFKRLIDVFAFCKLRITYEKVPNICSSNTYSWTVNAVLVLARITNSSSWACVAATIWGAFNWAPSMGAS